MPDQSTGQPPQYVAAHLQRALTEDPRTAAQGIRVTVHGTQAYLRGDVTSEDRRRVLLDVATEAAPELSIHDELRVVAPAPPTADEELT
jgi:osmotically-inducible protein OsmY